jgi:hypothetical protein
MSSGLRAGGWLLIALGVAAGSLGLHNFAQSESAPTPPPSPVTSSQRAITPPTGPRQQSSLTVPPTSLPGSVHLGTESEPPAVPTEARPTRTPASSPSPLSTRPPAPAPAWKPSHRADSPSQHRTHPSKTLDDHPSSRPPPAVTRTETVTVTPTPAPEVHHSPPPARTTWTPDAVSSLPSQALFRLDRYRATIRGPTGRSP